MICLGGLIMIRLELDSERRRGSETERDEVLVEVNLSLRGYNDPGELGDGLCDVESEKERKRSKLQGGGGRGGRGGRGGGDKRGQKWKNLSVKCSSSPERERQRRKSPTLRAEGPSDYRSWY